MTGSITSLIAIAYVRMVLILVQEIIVSFMFRIYGAVGSPFLESLKRKSSVVGGLQLLVVTQSINT